MQTPTPTHAFVTPAKMKTFVHANGPMTIRHSIAYAFSLLLLFGGSGFGQAKNAWTTPEIMGMPDGREYYFQEAVFTDDSTGWLVDQFGVLLKSTNGGSSWSLAKHFDSRKTSSIQFLSSEVGYVAGGWDTEDKRNGQCFIGWTRDAGKTWEDVSPIASGTRTCHLWDIFFVDAELGWAVGVAQRPSDSVEKGIVFRTEDGGRSWKQIDKKVENAGVIFAVEFESRNTGFAASNTGVWKTTDGGEIWSLVYESKTEQLFDVALIDRDVWTVGSNGTIVSSKDSGNTWHKAPLPANLAEIWFAKIAADPSGRFWVLGGFAGRSAVLLSDDKGSSWTREKITDSAGFLRSIAFTSGNCVVLAGQTNLLFRWCR